MFLFWNIWRIYVDIIVTSSTHIVLYWYRFGIHTELSEIVSYQSWRLRVLSNTNVHIINVISVCRVHSGVMQLLHNILPHSREGPPHRGPGASVHQWACGRNHTWAGQKQRQLRMCERWRRDQKSGVEEQNRQIKNTVSREKIRVSGERRRGESDRKVRQSEEQKGEITNNWNPN